MNLIDDMDLEVNDNSLDAFLGLSHSPSDHSIGLFLSSDEPADKGICGTYGWIWNDEEPSNQQMEAEEDETIL